LREAHGLGLEVAAHAHGPPGVHDGVLADVRYGDLIAVRDEPLRDDGRRGGEGPQLNSISAGMRNFCVVQVTP
jgi:hypothetical protein